MAEFLLGLFVGVASGVSGTVALAVVLANRTGRKGEPPVLFRPEEMTIVDTTRKPDSAKSGRTMWGT